MNEDRHRFLTAFGLGFCSAGNHATEKAYIYENAVYCPEHRPEGRGADPPAVGRCDWGKGHWATAIWHVPRDRHNYCLAHLSRIVYIATWLP